MFSWICPRCGRENRPNDSECPYCKNTELAEGAVPEISAQEPVHVAPPPQRPVPPPAAPVYAAPPAAHVAAPVPPSPQRDPLHAPLQHPETRRYAPEPARRSGLPTWLLVIVFAFAFVGLGAAVYYGYQRYQKGGGAGFTGGETSANAPKPKGTNALQKYIEVVGIRVTTNAKKKPEARFVVVNHASSELNDLTANVTLWASTSRSEEDSVGTFTFTLASIERNEAKEITAPLKTKLKLYEMPDWQNVTAEVQITSP